MKLLYVSKAFDGNIGAALHYRALKELYGEENIITYDLRPVSAYYGEKYKCPGKYKNNLDRIHRWFQGNMMFISNNIIADICNTIEKEKIDIVFIEDSVFGNLVKTIKIRFPQTHVLTFYHDIKADLYPKWIKKNKNLLSYVEYSIGIKQERMNKDYADVNIVFNERDATVFEKYYKKRPEAIIPLPAPIPDIPDNTKWTVTSSNEKKHLLFVGKNYYPNIVGFKWFVEKILPKVSSSIQIDVVGRGLEELRAEYSDLRINIVGGVESLNPYYENADIVIAPLFDGGGMKSKTVEALSFGKLFVGTEESLFGFWEEMDDTIRGKKCYQCNTPEAWISTINNLVNSTISKFNEDVFDLFKTKFSYDVIKDRLKEIIEE